MTNDKTVTMSRELIEKAAHRLSDLGQSHISEPMFAAILAKSELADHCKQCADTVQTWPESKRDCLVKIAAPVVERQPDAILEGCMTSVGITHAIYASTVRLKDKEQVRLYREPPELAELQALNEDAMAVNKTLNQQMDALQATIANLDSNLCRQSVRIARLKAENERLKAGQGEPVAWANWKVGSRSYVPFRSNDEAQRSVNASEISATQNGPYRVVPLYTSQPAPVSVVLDETQAFANWTHQVIVEMENNGAVHRVQRRDRMSLSEEKAAFDAWNARACLDKVKELNQ